MVIKMKINTRDTGDISKRTDQSSKLENPFERDSDPIVNYLGASKKEAKELSILKRWTKKERELWRKLPEQKKKKMIRRILNQVGMREQQLNDAASPPRKQNNDTGFRYHLAVSYTHLTLPTTERV